MRESIGGAWLLGIAVTLISIFTAYLAFSVNYAKAFKVKDGIVERIEKYEGFADRNFIDGRPDSNPVKEIREYLNKIAYNNKGQCSTRIGVGVNGTPFYGVDGTNVDKNNSTNRYTYCVERVTKLGDTGDYTSAYYKVTVFYGLSFGFVDLNSIFFLTGETKNIYYPKDDEAW